MNDSDDSWLDALAGRSGAAGSEEANPEGASLRAAIQARHDAAPLQVALEDPHREDVLVERARREGLLSSHGSAARTRRTRLPAWSAWLTAAVLACVCVITWDLRERSSVPVVRGAHPGIVTVQSADPLQLKQDLLRELRAAGVAADGYERFGRQGIDADLPTPLPPAVRDILQRRGISMPQGTVLQLEIEPSAGP